MVKVKDECEFKPTIAIFPGETIKENMEYLGIKQKELAIRLGITQKHLSHIINGKAPITYETALKLEKVFGSSAKFWMNLETNYQLDLSRLKEEENMKDDLEILKQIPYKHMSTNSWVKDTKKRSERVNECRKFFGVSRLKDAKDSYCVAFRKQKAINDISNLGILAWLRKVELESLDKNVESFSVRKIKKNIQIIRELTMEAPEIFYPKLVETLKECGIALILVPYIPKTYICGATFWRNNKTILALTDRGKRADTFWFTLFHELAHLLKEDNRKVHILYENKNNENEIDKLAAELLINEKDYKEFLDNYNYQDKNDIMKYANEIEIAPFILLGRLQHDKYLGYDQFNELKTINKIEYLEF